MRRAQAIDAVPILCRDCLSRTERNGRCRACGSPRLVRHAELDQLSLAHLDCDAFYAAVEKRDNPDLLDKPLIIGGGRRGVVSTACYIARINGVRSAMPMFKALRACPEAVVMRPDMKKYVAVAREIRSMMQKLTPLVEPISIDEAFLDLSGTERLHDAPPCVSLARLAGAIEREIGITVSIGLSYNKFLAKLASDQDKPRGFSIIGRAEAPKKLAPLPVTVIPGVGKAAAKALDRAGITRMADLQTRDPRVLAELVGSQGPRLHELAHGLDKRVVTPDSPPKSVSNETTFEDDIADLEALRATLWRLTDKLSGRLKDKAIGGSVVTLKLKTADFRILTRRLTLDQPTQLADRIFEVASELLEQAADGTAYRLIGVGVSDLADAEFCDRPSLFGSDERRKNAERAMDAVRARFGSSAIDRGIGLAGHRNRRDKQT
ncbi:MAG: DNA polymerase IV [Pseudomonadota bacterium]